MDSRQFHGYKYLLCLIPAITACTAVVTEISYRNQAGISGDVVFLSEAEWIYEISVILGDLGSEQARREVASGGADHPSVIAWRKVKFYSHQHRILAINICLDKGPGRLPRTKARGHGENVR